MSSNKRQKSEEEEEAVFVYTGSVEVPKNATKVIIGASVTKIPARAFSHCKQLNEVELNDGMQKVGDFAFFGCASLTRIEVPSSVTEIGCSAFYGCANLREVVLNEGLQKSVTEVGSYAFFLCINLREVVLNEGLQKIRDNAFAHCTSSTVIKFPTISKRAKNLIDTGITEIEDKLTSNQYFEWRGGELLVHHDAIGSANWKATRTHLDRVLTWVSYYELREATTTVALALWKIKIGETGAATVEERDACRGEVPGPVKDAIIQHLQVDVGVDGNESDDSSQYSNISSEDESGDH